MDSEERSRAIRDAFFGRLPEYSTERFYLLSELQESCRGGIVCLDELDDGEGASPPPPPAKHSTAQGWSDASRNSNESSGDGGPHEAISLNACPKNLLVYYVTWRTEEPVKTLVDRVARIAYQCSLPNKYTMIAVDILFDASTTTAAAQAAAREGMRSVASVFPDAGCISAGLTSSPAAIPALDVVYDRMRWLRRVGVHWTVISMHRSDFLGYFGEDSQEAEPEAVSGVSQYFAAVPNVRSWVETECAVDLTPYCGPSQSSSTEGAGAGESNNKKSSAAAAAHTSATVDFDAEKEHAAAARVLNAKHGLKDFIRLQALAFAVLSMLLWWYFHKES